jgi:hypothetical protein
MPIKMAFARRSASPAGSHICFDVLDHLLNGTPSGRIVGGPAMKFGGWHRLNSEYAKQFGMEMPRSASGSSSAGGPIELEQMVRQTHRWLSIAFTVGGIANLFAGAQKKCAN